MEGGRGKSRPLTPDLPAPAGQLVMPKGLCPEGKREWARHVEWIRAMKLESPVDAGQVEALVRHLVRARKADRKGQGMLATQAWKAYSAQAGQFGMGPAARAKLAPAEGKPEGAGDVPEGLRDASAR